MGSCASSESKGEPVKASLTSQCNKQKLHDEVERQAKLQRTTDVAFSAAHRFAYQQENKRNSVGKRGMTNENDGKQVTDCCVCR